MINKPQGRHYKVGEKELPSVTTILGMLDKPALIFWSAKMATESFDEQLQAFYEIEKCRFVIPDTKLPGILETAKKAHRTFKKEAAAIGTLCHEGIALWIDSGGMFGPENLDNEYQRRGLQAFLDYGQQHHIEILASEQVVSDGATFAGRFDLLCKLDGKLTLLDFKTSSGIYPEMWIQTHAYASCIKPRPKQLAVFQINKETGEHHVETRPYNPAITRGFKFLAKAFPIIKGVK